jgi:hypothetical protein
MCFRYDPSINIKFFCLQVFFNNLERTTDVCATNTKGVGYKFRHAIDCTKYYECLAG